MNKIGRNVPCHCGSGKKYKKCCMHNDKSANVIYAPFGRERAEYPDLSNKATKEVITGDLEINAANKEIMDEAINVIEKGQWQEAEKMLLAHMSENDNVYLRNNLALALFMSGKTELALKYLDPCLRGETDLEGNPFTFALAARALSELGKYDYALQCLDNAVLLFDRGLELLKENDELENSNWGEYTVIIMRAAADLQDHQQVYNLYLRWEKEHLNWENAYLAGVASFNMANYREAGSLWKSLNKDFEMAGQMEKVALAAAEGVIPGFRISYKVKSGEDFDQILAKLRQDMSLLGEVLKNTDFLFIFLFMIFYTKTPEEIATQLVREIVSRGGEWGKAFGERLLAYSGDFNIKHINDLKLAAAEGLLERGVFAPNEPIPIFIDGKENHITLSKVEMMEKPDKKTNQAMQKAMDLHNQDRIEEAIKVLENVYRDDKIYVPAVFKLANLLCIAERLEEAEIYLRKVETILPDNPTLLYNLSVVMLDLGRRKEAQEYYEAIDPQQANQEVKKKLPELKELVYSSQPFFDMPDVDDIVGMIAEKQREKVEEKTLTKEASLLRCLRNMPAGWLELICDHLNIKPASKRKEREQQIIEKLTQPETLLFITKAYFRKEHLDILRHILTEQGWAYLNVITRKHGSLEGDGFFWAENPPFSPLGQLWSMGLVAVGKATINSRRVKIVVIPKEIREPLSALLKKQGE